MKRVGALFLLLAICSVSLVSTPSFAALDPVYKNCVNKCATTTNNLKEYRPGCINDCMAGGGYL